MEQEVRLIVPNAQFRPPATRELIEHAEAQLGVALPAPLRELYRAFDGFREPLANASYLLPLLDDDGVGSLVTTSLYHWNDWKEPYPELDLCPFLFFGLSASDENWGIELDAPHRVIAYHHHMGGEFEMAGATIPTVYRENQRVLLAIDDDMI